LNVKALLSGSIGKVGSHYVIGLEAIACQSGETLARDQVEVPAREEVLAGLGTMASRMRRKLGESLASMSRFDVPLTQATTSSLEALKAFSAAEEQRAQGLELEAIPLYKRALELDPDFALASGRLTAIYGNLREWSRSGEYARHAFARQNRVSERERFYIASGYYIAGPDTNFDKYGETLMLWASAYPRDWYPLFAIADFFNTTGQYAKGVQPAQQALQLNPRNSLAYERLAETYAGLNAWAESKAVLESAEAARRDSMGIHEQLFELAVIEGDHSAAARHVAFAAGRADEDEMLQARAEAAAFHGKLAQARDLWSRAANTVERAGFVESAAIIHSDQAVVESLCGDRQRTLTGIAEALERSRPVIALANAAQALANIGEMQRAEKVRRELGQFGPLGGWLQPGVTVTDAMLQIWHDDPSAALQTLERTRPVNLGRYTALRPPYVRGLALLAMNDGAAASREFQDILDHRGIAPLSILYPLARLQQGRAYVLTGEYDKAKKTYESFLAVWQDADREIPIFEAARREYAALGRYRSP
jgi:eukaryotic-like serine/threonine-protein kinase